jgi:hypothetical protein
MKPSRQFLTLLLGIFVVLGMSPSAVQAGGMVAKMTVMSGMGGHGDCGGCEDGNSGSAQTMACGSICMASVLAVPPQPFSMWVVAARAMSLGQYPHPHDRAPQPDPYPPRPGDLG